MAKGDHTRVQNQINQQGLTSQNDINSLQNMFAGQNLGFQNNYNYGTNNDLGTFNNLMGNYQNVMGGLAGGTFGVGNGFNLGGGNNQGGGQGGPNFNGMGGGWDQFNQQGSPQNALQDAFANGLQGQQAVDYANNALGLQPPNSISFNNDGTYGLPNGFYAAPNAQNGQLDLIQRSGGGGGGGGGLNPTLQEALGGYENFAQTGGYAPQDLQNIRDQAVAANQAAFKTGMSDVNQQRALQQFSPNYDATMANLARNMGYTNSTAAQNANAQIAQMVQQGKLAGLGGITGVGGLQNQAQMANLNALMGTLGGQTGLYGSTPGLASTFGNQLLGSSNQMLGTGNLQNQLGGQMIQGQLGESQVPGDFSQAMGNIGLGAGFAGDLLSPFTGGLSGGLGGLFGGTNGPNMQQGVAFTPTSGGFNYNMGFW